MPRVPTLTSPSSKEHAQSKGNYSKINNFKSKISLGVRPGTLQDFCIESQRMIPAPFTFSRQSQSAKGR